MRTPLDRPSSRQGLIISSTLYLVKKDFREFHKLLIDVECLGE